MKRVLGVLSILAIVGIGGNVWAGTPSTDKTCCGENQKQIDQIHSINDKQTEQININSRNINTINHKVDSIKTEDRFYISGSVGINFATGTDADDVFDDNGWQGAVALGNQIQEHVRVEAEYQYLDNNGDLDINSIMANGYYDFGTWKDVTPYVTTGIGIGWFDVNDVDMDHSLVWKLGVGADYAINEEWEIGLRYTYFNAVDNVDYDTNQINAIISMSF